MAKLLNNYKKEYNLMSAIDEYAKDFGDYFKRVLKQFGEEIDESKLDTIVSKQVAGVEQIMKNGIDIGTLIENVVPVKSLEKHTKVGWAYNTPKGYFKVELVE